MPAAAQSFLDVVEKVRNRELLLSSPVMIEVAQVTQSHGNLQPPSLRTQTTSERDIWFLNYASEYGHNVCYVLDAGRSLTIGRSRACDLRVRDRSVSSVHARLRFDRPQMGYFLTDEGSRNGTFLSGERVKPNVETPIWSGALLSFGQAAFIFVLSSTIRKLARLATSD